jgi:hypothetical protein
MIQAIERDEYETAVNLAEDLDSRSGPHIEFEERYIFPVLEEEFGEAYATRLYDEHADLIATLVELQQFDASSRPPTEAKKRWLEDLRTGLARSTESKTFLGNLRAMSPEQKALLLNRHRRLRLRAHRWSQLHPPPSEC